MRNISSRLQQVRRFAPAGSTVFTFSFSHDFVSINRIPVHSSVVWIIWNTFAHWHEIARNVVFGGHPNRLSTKLQNFDDLAGFHLLSVSFVYNAYRALWKNHRSTIYRHIVLIFILFREFVSICRAIDTPQCDDGWSINQLWAYLFLGRIIQTCVTRDLAPTGRPCQEDGGPRWGSAIALTSLSCSCSMSWSSSSLRSLITSFPSASPRYRCSLSARYIAPICWSPGNFDPE